MGNRGRFCERNALFNRVSCSPSETTEAQVGRRTQREEKSRRRAGARVFETSFLREHANTRERTWHGGSQAHMCSTFSAHERTPPHGTCVHGRGQRARYGRSSGRSGGHAGVEGRGGCGRGGWHGLASEDSGGGSWMFVGASYFVSAMTARHPARWPQWKRPSGA
jgi:hypothetical protein